MSIQILEQFVEGKSDDRVCEDMIVISDEFAAVIDGASDATGVNFSGVTGGRLAAEALAEAIDQLSPTADARQFADSVAAAVANAVKATVGELAADVRWPVAVVACASVHRRQVWRIGDCTVVIGGVEYCGGKRVDDAAYGFRAAINAATMNGGVSLAEVIEADPGARAARSLIDIQQHLANVVGPWGFGCVNGQRVPDEYLEVLPIPDKATEVIIASDGFPAVLPTLSESEARLTEMIGRDPAAIGELAAIGKPMRPGAHAPDDRAYLRFAMTSDASDD